MTHRDNNEGKEFIDFLFCCLIFSPFRKSDRPSQTAKTEIRLNYVWRCNSTLTKDIVFSFRKKTVKSVNSVTGCFAINVRNKCVYCAGRMQSSTFYSGWYIKWPLILKWLIIHIYYLFWLKFLLKTLLLKNLFTDFPIAIKGKIQQDLYFVRDLWQLNRQWYFRRAIYPDYFPVFHTQKYVASYSGSAHSFTLNILNHELRWLKKY